MCRNSERFIDRLTKDIFRLQPEIEKEKKDSVGDEDQRQDDFFPESAIFKGSDQCKT
jgi:hypothetical protein